MPTATSNISKSNYKIAIGHNIVLAALQPFNPQPRSPGMKYTRVTYLGGGNPYVEGAYIELMWSALDDKNVYNTILTLAGVHDSLWQDVTLYARDDEWNYGVFNGSAHRPFIGSDANWEYFPRDITMLIKNLEQTA
jgi:hypothetical protein